MYIYMYKDTSYSSTTRPDSWPFFLAKDGLYHPSAPQSHGLHHGKREAPKTCRTRQESLVMGCWHFMDQHPNMTNPWLIGNNN